MAILTILMPFKDTILKGLGFLIKPFTKGKLIEWQIRVTELKFDDPVGVEDFTKLYNETFPDDGTNYTAEELLDAVEDPNNEKKHVQAHNITLIAYYNNAPIGFMACYYYPTLEYGIIGYIGRTKEATEKAGEAVRYSTIKLIEKLNSIIHKKHKCKLLVYELEIGKRDGEKMQLFKSCAQKLNLKTYELDFDYWRPKTDLEDKSEEKLRLVVIPIQTSLHQSMSKNEVLEILNFLHFYCYGDYYDISDPKFNVFQDYLKTRMAFYEKNLPDIIKIK